MSANKYIYGFTLLNLGPATLKKIHHYFQGDFKKAWQTNNTNDLLSANIQVNLAKKIISNKKIINLNKEWNKFLQTKIKFLTTNEETYPQQLREIKSAPFMLFYLGNLSLLQKKQLAVVGARRYTTYGKMVTEKIIPEISQAGLIITSGMAQGIDSLAHQEALNYQQPTIAVLGSGIQEAQKNNYAKQMIDNILSQNGLILSEYQPFYPAGKYTFPARNRIVSGLSLGTLVIEAGTKSGTLITANYALEQNREIFAVPGNIFSEQSTGTHQLIKKGAQLVTSANDILEALNFTSTQTSLFRRKNIQFDDSEEELIYKKLSFDPIFIDKLAKNCKLDTTIISSKLSILEIKGLARNIGGGRFIKG